EIRISKFETIPKSPYPPSGRIVVDRRVISPSIESRRAGKRIFQSTDRNFFELFEKRFITYRF
ncbi:TPA: hypothetical protein DCP42_03325, partial [Patescibacteria group bacterium]|nr:hypothetical protein [Patescibacteria group bacterium]